MIKLNKLCILLILIVICLVGCSKTKYEAITNTEEFEALFEGALKYDIRNTTACEEGHIPSFICMGNSDNDQIIETITITVKDKERNIIIIGENEDIEYIFKKLSRKKYQNLYTFNGGYNEYINQKGPDFVPEEGCDC